MGNKSMIPAEGILEIAKRIARETEKVIEEIKKRDCLLNQKIEKCPDIDSLKKFSIYEYWSNSESVNVFQVVGTAHPDYNNGITWIEMLKVGKRMPLNLSLLEKNPFYYFETTKKDPEINYVKVDDRIYISGEGNHRTAIAKVLFYYLGCSVVHGIEFTEYRIDHELKELFENLKTLVYRKLPYVKLELVRNCVKRDDTPGWRKDYFTLGVKFINYKNGKWMLVERKEDLRIIVEEIQNLNFWSKFLKKGTVSKIL